MCLLCVMLSCLALVHFFFFNDTATTEIYTLSLHDALPIWPRRASRTRRCFAAPRADRGDPRRFRDRKSTRLNSSHGSISYAVFCLKKKKTKRAVVVLAVQAAAPEQVQRRSDDPAPVALAQQ